jgi:uncharacterized protein YbbK (DUF523 family)
LVRAGKAIPLCPEQLGGLPTPREASEIQGELVVTKKGIDVTSQFMRGADIVLEIARFFNCTEAILKSLSPSCGVGRIYDGTFSKTAVSGDGVTARLLKKNGIHCVTEDSRTVQ